MIGDMIHTATMTPSAFKSLIRRHYRRHGRNLPWRRTRDPYEILVSEIMLQQTQVARVEGYYANFLARFPDIGALARASLADVLSSWQGLGYNHRALYLRRAAREIVMRHGGAVPHDPVELARLPGIGPNTAGAIAAFAFNAPTVFIETNIRRVYLHFFFARRRRVPDAALMPLIGRTLDRKNPREWYYALMDYGAMLGAVRKGGENPNRRSRRYIRQTRFEGSDRQVRAAIIKLLLKEKSLAAKKIAGQLAEPPDRIRKITASLIRDGLIKKSGADIGIA
jgi:A/G-specific adenine glycosylase